MFLLLPAILISGALCGACIGLLLYVRFVGWIPFFGIKQRIRKVFGDTASYFNQQQRTENQQHLSFLEKLVLKLAPSSPREQDKIRLKLMRAGFRQKKHISHYYLLKYSGIITAAVCGVSLWNIGFISAYFVIFFPFIFLFLPDIVLTMITKKRLQRVIMALPDFIDMCNISMTAGLGWLNSVKKVTGELEAIHPEICQEFTYLFDQTQAGIDRIEAFNRLFSRNPAPEMQYLVTVMIQNEKMGSSISHALADLSERIYYLRQQSVEEKAGKLPAKMIIIAIFFIFLPFLLILLGEPLVTVTRLLGQ
jgi:tight adherence protein C